MTPQQDLRHRPVFFLSPGRSGTQTLAHVLHATYADVANVVHEPIDYQYKPNQFYRRYDRLGVMLDDPIIATHIRSVEASVVAQQKTYIEVGWPCFAALPYFYDIFEGEIAIVNLVRNPFKVAASLTTQGFHDAGTENPWALHGMLAPDRSELIQPEALDRWHGLSPFERNLVHWMEFVLYFEELRERLPRARFLQMRFEDCLSDGNHLRRLTEFLGLPWKDGLEGAMRTQIDVASYRTRRYEDFRLKVRPDGLATAAKRLGYPVSNWNFRTARKFYAISPFEQFTSRVRSRLRRTLGLGNTRMAPRNSRIGGQISERIR